MPHSNQVQQVTALLREAGLAHHAAYIEVDGSDPDWPLWYAEHLHEELMQALNASFTKSELIYLIVWLDRDQRLNAPGADWALYYAKILVERYLE